MKEKIIEILYQLKDKLGEYGEKILVLEETGSLNTKEGRRIMRECDLIIDTIEVLYINDYTLVDENQEEVFNFYTDENKLDKFLDAIRFRFKLGLTGAGGDIAFGILEVVKASNSLGGNVTEGQLGLPLSPPGYILITDQNGNWVAQPKMTILDDGEILD